MANKNPNPVTRFKKGKSGNADGRPALDPKIKQIKKLTAEEFETMVSALFETTETGLKQLIADQNAPYLKRIVASILKKTFETGSMGQLDMVLSRVIGKVKEKLEHTFVKPSILKRIDGSEIVFTNRPIEEEEE